MARSYMTRSQYITKLCVERRAAKEARVAALLRGDPLDRVDQMIAFLDHDISCAYQPPNLGKKK